MRKSTRRAVLAGIVATPAVALSATAELGLSEDPVLAEMDALRALRREVAKARDLAIALEQACFAGRERLSYWPDKHHRQEWDRAECALNDALNAMEEKEDEIVELTPIGPAGALALLGLVAARIEGRRDCYSAHESAADGGAIRKAQTVLASAVAKGGAI